MKSTAAGLSLACGTDGRSEWVFAPDYGSGFEVRAVEGKGVGCFALHDFKPGERLLAELPLCVWSTALGRPAELNRIVARLSDADRADFFALSNGINALTPHGIWLANAYPIGDRNARVGGRQAAVFRLACRFNHACAPNAHASWNEALGMQTIHAQFNILAGQEISVGYMGGDGAPRAGRRAALQSKFGFACGCTLCELTGTPLRKSDERQAAVARLGADINREPRPQNTIALVERRLRLMREEGMPPVWGKSSMFTAQIHAAGRRDYVRADTWATQASECARASTGSDSPEYELHASFIGKRPEGW